MTQLKQIDPELGFSGFKNSRTGTRSEAIEGMTRVKPVSIRYGHDVAMPARPSPQT